MPDLPTADDPEPPQVSAEDHPVPDPSPGDEEPGEPAVVVPAAPQPYRFGCLAKVLVFVAMVALGLFARNVIHGRSEASTTTIDKGRAGAVAWQVKASVDEQRSRCVQLFATGGAASSSDGLQQADSGQLTGGCISSQGQATGSDVHEAELPGTGTWVIFGQAPKGTRSVSLPLTDGSTRKVAVSGTTTSKDAYYVWVAPKGVHTTGSARFS